MAEAAWPAIREKKFTALTLEEHAQIIAKEANQERRLYHEMLWETGGSQTDIAQLSWDQIDLKIRWIQFNRQKLRGKDGGNSCLRIGLRLSHLLDQLPQSGKLFPRLALEKAHHRSSEFKRRCRTLKIENRTLHSYRYAWAQRARIAGMPERDAMNHLGHKSRAIHAAYGMGAQVAVLPFEYYEQEAAKKVINFNQAEYAQG